MQLEHLCQFAFQFYTFEIVAMFVFFFPSNSVDLFLMLYNLRKLLKVKSMQENVFIEAHIFSRF